jgi:hypothetical protein
MIPVLCLDARDIKTIVLSLVLFCLIHTIADN